MSMSDPLADMLTRIRNAVMVKFDSVEMPKSKVKVNVAKVLEEEGYINGWEVTDEGPQGTLGRTDRRRHQCFEPRADIERTRIER